MVSQNISQSNTPSHRLKTFPHTIISEKIYLPKFIKSYEWFIWSYYKTAEHWWCPCLIAAQRSWLTFGNTQMSYGDIQPSLLFPNVTPAWKFIKNSEDASIVFGLYLPSVHYTCYHIHPIKIANTAHWFHLEKL